MKLSTIALKILNEIDGENPVTKVSQAMEDYDTYLDRNKGILFSKNELDSIQGLKMEPESKSSEEIKFGSIDQLNGLNKIITVRKFKIDNSSFRYAAFVTMKEPTDVSLAADPTASPDAGNKIMIYFSKTFVDVNGDLDLLYDFIQKIQE